MMTRAGKTNYFAYIDTLRAKLTQVHSSLPSNPFNSDLTTKSKQIVENQTEEIDATQKSRIQWLEAGDANTTFFHASTKRRNNKLNIKSLTDNGTTLTTRPKLAGASISFFQKLWSGDQAPSSTISYPLKKLSVESCEWLKNLISEDEIKQAVFDVDSNKAPGLDKFPASFYQTCWAIIQANLIKVVKYFFLEGRMLKEANSAFIALIPKVQMALLSISSGQSICATSSIRSSPKLWQIALRK